MAESSKITEKALRKGLFLIAGPCVIESRACIMKVAEFLAGLRRETGVFVIFKASYDKANRTSIKGFRGPGMNDGLILLEEVRQRYGLPVLTDVHSPAEARRAGAFVDIVQIPAFLCRQTDLILAACDTPAWVNIKKGQFMAPWDMAKVVEKARSRRRGRIMLCERGSSFGYNNLVSDLRSIPVMRETGCPVVYDATHSVQAPGGKGDCSGGDRRFVPTLSRAAVAAGADGLFWEMHPRPDSAMSDGPNMLPLSEVKALLRSCLAIRKALGRKK